MPLGRYATRDEIADLALFLSSEAATYITGATFAIDGGQQNLGSFAIGAMLHEAARGARG